MTVVALNDNTQLFMISLQKKIKQGKKKGTLHSPDLIVPVSLDIVGNLSQVGSCCLLQYGLFVLPQTLDATITDTFFQNN